MLVHSRHVLYWKLSNNLVTEFCLEALVMVLGSSCRLQIFYPNQGYHFKSIDFVPRLQTEEINISLAHPMEVLPFKTPQFTVWKHSPYCLH
jgi:hypothetical protein